MVCLSFLARLDNAPSAHSGIGPRMGFAFAPRSTEPIGRYAGHALVPSERRVTGFWGQLCSSKRAQVTLDEQSILRVRLSRTKLKKMAPVGVIAPQLEKARTKEGIEDAINLGKPVLPDQGYSQAILPGSLSR